MFLNSPNFPKFFNFMSCHTQISYYMNFLHSPHHFDHFSFFKYPKIIKTSRVLRFRPTRVGAQTAVCWSSAETSIGCVGWYQDIEERARGKRRRRTRVTPERYKNKYDAGSTLSDFEPISPTHRCNRSCTCSKSLWKLNRQWQEVVYKTRNEIRKGPTIKYIRYLKEKFSYLWGFWA